jgi:hypothetical protein
MAFCANCGNEISEMATTCPRCGHPTGAGGAIVAGATAQGATAPGATAALVCGIIGIFFCPIVLSTIAIVQGGKAKRQIEANPSLGGASQANAGVILGWVGIAVGALLLIAVFASRS